jgi:hypothetical protein
MRGLHEDQIRGNVPGSPSQSAQCGVTVGVPKQGLRRDRHVDEQPFGCKAGKGTGELGIRATGSLIADVQHDRGVDGRSPFH